MRLLLLAAVILPFAAYAGDASSYKLRKGIDSGDTITEIKPKHVGYHIFSSVRNSAAWSVTAAADVCMTMAWHSESDTTPAVQIRRIVSAATENGSFPLAVVLDGCNCLRVTGGSYYINVTQSPESSDALVTVTGRD